MVSVVENLRAVKWCALQFMNGRASTMCVLSCFGIDRNEKDQEYCRYRNNPGEGDVSELHPATPSVRYQRSIVSD